MTAARVCVPKVSYSCILPLWDSLNSAGRLTQDHFKWLLLPWVPEDVRFCVCPWRVESLFLTALWVSQIEVLWTSKSNILGAHLPGAGCLGCGNWWGLRTPVPWSNPHICNYPLVCGLPPWGVHGILLYPYTKPTIPMFLPLLSYFDSITTLAVEDIFY